MKMYDPENTSKSWSIFLGYDENEWPAVLAVDSISGRKICTLIFFGPSGLVQSSRNAAQLLEEEGYNPYEHRNNFSGSGALIIQTHDRDYYDKSEEE